MIELIEEFLNSDGLNVGAVENERSLQLELGLFLRRKNFSVQFEKNCKVAAHQNQSKRQKRYLDLLVGKSPDAVAIELKVPLSGRVPETKYDFISDIAFVEAVIKSNIASNGICLMVTNDKHFWSGRAEGIYTAFRNEGTLHGTYEKPTGNQASKIYLENDYKICWRSLKNTRLMEGAKYLILQTDKR